MVGPANEAVSSLVKDYLPGDTLNQIIASSTRSPFAYTDGTAILGAIQNRVNLVERWKYYFLLVHCFTLGWWFLIFHGLVALSMILPL